MIVQYIDNFQLHEFKSDTLSYQWYSNKLYIAGFKTKIRAELYRDKCLMNHEIKQD